MISPVKGSIAIDYQHLPNHPHARPPEKTKEAPKLDTVVLSQQAARANDSDQNGPKR